MDPDHVLGALDPRLKTDPGDLCTFSLIIDVMRRTRDNHHPALASSGIEVIDLHVDVVLGVPGRHVVDPIAVVMYALDGTARIVHIWPFSGLDERVAVRRRLVEENKWPPLGGPEHILEATSTMAWPLPGSPLH
jgi:hypothetical protein